MENNRTNDIQDYMDVHITESNEVQRWNHPDNEIAIDDTTWGVVPENERRVFRGNHWQDNVQFNCNDCDAVYSSHTGLYNHIKLSMREWGTVVTSVDI